MDDESGLDCTMGLASLVSDGDVRLESLLAIDSTDLQSGEVLLVELFFARSDSAGVLGSWNIEDVDLSSTLIALVLELSLFFGESSGADSVLESGSVFSVFFSDFSFSSLAFLTFSGSKLSLRSCSSLPA